MATIIANPIYDSVFKFLMEDQRAAKVILSDLLQREVVEVNMRNNDYVKKINSDITVLRIDFSAKVRDASGNIENVNIELQKAWLTTEIMRFRKYLAQQYQSDANKFIIQDKPLKEKPLHMVNIYLLGHKVDKLDLTVTYVYPKMYDQYGDPIEGLISDVDFVNELVHDMIIVQIPKITKAKVKSRLDNLLTLFDQAQRWQNDHQLCVNEQDYTEDHKYVLNRLIYAKADESVCKDMDLEDEFQTILEQWEQKESDYKDQLALQRNKLSEQQSQLTQQQSQLDEQQTQLATQQSQLDEQQTQLATQQSQLDEQQTQLATQKNQLDEQQTQLATQQSQLDEQQTQLATQQNQLSSAIRALLAAGKKEEEIALIMNLSLQEITRLLGK